MTPLKPTPPPGVETFYKNVAAALVGAAYAFVMSFLIWKALDMVMEVHVSAECASMGR